MPNRTVNPITTARQGDGSHREYLIKCVRCQTEYQITTLNMKFECEDCKQHINPKGLLHTVVIVKDTEEESNETSEEEFERVALEAEQATYQFDEADLGMEF